MNNTQVARTKSLVVDKLKTGLESNQYINLIYDKEAKNRLEFSRTDNHAILGGGIGLRTPFGGCSTAFTATKGNQKFLATAGHCLNGDGGIITQYTNNVGRDHVSYFRSRGFDIALIDVTNSGRKISNNIFAKATTFYDAKYTQSGSFIKNQYVCKSGVTTGYTCGQVQETATDYYAENTKQTVRDVAKIYASGSATNYSSSGDSGSVVWAGNVLLGVHSGGGDNDDFSWGYAAKTSKVSEHFGTTFTINKSNSPF